jgi:uncharacterized membrane protein
MAIAPAYLIHWLPGKVGLSTKIVLCTSMFLLSISPILSFVNIRFGTFKTRTQVTTIDYIVFWGIPIPIPRIGVAEQKTIVAINAGGAIVPLIVGLVFIYSTLLMGDPLILYATVTSVIITTLYTYASSRVIPGVGIVAPGLGIALVSLVVSLPILGKGPIFIPAYVGASFGSLLGADVLRLLKDRDRINAPLISIGGAGVFDGIYLSGALAITLGLLFS